MIKELIISLRESSNQLYARAGTSVHLYLVDNSTDEKYFSRLKVMCEGIDCSEAFRLELLCSSNNLGYGGGNNLVLDQLDSSYHLVINPDVIVGSGALYKAVTYLECNDDVAMLSPMVVEENGRRSHVVKVYPDCFTLMLRYLGRPTLNRWFSHRLGRYQCDQLSDQADKNTELAGGCFQLMRTDLFKRLGGFDDRFFMYFEDYDLSIRARVFGSISYVPAVQISHAGGDVGRKTFAHHRFFVASALRFFNKHGWRFW